MMIRLDEDGYLQGIRIARNALSISHLFCADDSLFCFKATHESFAKLREMINVFCKVTGEAMNFDKSSVIFSPDTPDIVKNELKDILGTPCTDKLGKYLGCDVEIDAWQIISCFSTSGR